MGDAQGRGHGAVASRDAVADERDRRADERDRRAAARDLLAAPEQQVERRAAWADRRAAAADRRAAASDRRAAAEDRERAETDELTGAMRRGSGLDALRRAVKRAHRTSEPLVVAFVDVDGLKWVNDAHGHAAGDTLLRTVVRATLANIRSYDVVIRYGGDEFLCALEGVSLERAGLRMAAIRKTLDDELGGASITVGLASIEPDDTVDDLVARADRAFYAQRTRGRFGPRASDHVR